MRARRAIVALAAATVACTGGDKIVAPDGEGPGNNNDTIVWNAGDSTFLVTSVRAAVFTDFNLLRAYSVVPVPNVGAATAACNPTVTGNVDANRNGIPDDATYTFTAQNCRTVDAGTTFTATGTVHAQDLGGIYAYRVSFGTFRVTGSKADSTAIIGLDGSEQLTIDSPTSATVTTALTRTLGAQAGSGSATIATTASLVSHFTAATGRQITVGQPLPAGTLQTTGTVTVVVTFTGNAIVPGFPAKSTFVVNVNTTTALGFNGFCSDQSAFDSGELRGQVSGTETGQIATRFTGCGQGPSQPPPPGVKR
jgi:hypothetical protein